MTFWLERVKWPDRPHYRHAGYPLGEDEHGLWCAVPAGLPIYRGDEQLFTSGWNSVMCVAVGREWTAWFLDPSVTGTDFDVYCDVVTPVRVREHGTWCIDLDLDVIRWTDGRGVEVVDRDEFEEHRVLFGYPDDVAASAERTADELAALIASGAAPFDGTTIDRWFERSAAVLSP